MKNSILKTYLLLLSVSCSILLQAQVGIVTLAAKSTLHVASQPLVANVPDGIIAPILTRAQLIGKDAQYGTAQTNAMVYVSTIDGTATAKTIKVINAGYYFFDGSVWQNIDQPGKYFYLPAFVLPSATVGTGRTFDLYTNVLGKQFNQSGNILYNTSNLMLPQLPVARYPANRFDYVVTYYDTDIIKINSISSSGVINYDVLNPVVGTAAFVNVVLITK